jgi:cystathionine beta-synthase
VVGSVGERGLLKHAIADAAVLDHRVEALMEPPFPSVTVEDAVRDAVELLAGDWQALTVTEADRPVGIVTRSDLLESLAR